MSTTMTIAPVPHRREFVLIAVGLIVLVAGELTVTNSLSLFTRHFWFDELFTQRLVSDPSLGHSLAALRGGVDSHPPALYLLLRVLTLNGHFSNEPTLRALSLLFTLTALLGLFAALRRSFGTLAAATGCLAVWSHPLVLQQAFEARGYSAWLAATVWFAHLLTGCRASPRMWYRVVLAVVAVFLCTVHYFGIITLALVTAAELFARWSGPCPRYAGVEAAALGLLALAACLPLLAGQRAAYTVHTWIEPANASAAKEFLFALLFPAILAAVPFAAWLSALTGARRGATPPAAPDGNLSAQAGLAGLMLLPFALVAFSFTVQSVLIGRYGLPAAAALGPVVAWTVSRGTRVWAFVLCAFFVVVGGRDLGRQAANNRVRDRESSELIDNLRTQTGSPVVVFEHAHALFVVQQYAPDIADRCHLLDFVDGEPPAAGLDVFVRDLVRKHAEYYHAPPLVAWSTLKMLPHFYVVGDSSAGAVRPLEEAYPGFSPHSVQGNLYEMVAIPGK